MYLRILRVYIRSRENNFNIPTSNRYCNNNKIVNSTQQYTFINYFIPMEIIFRIIIIITINISS